MLFYHLLKSVYVLKKKKMNVNSKFCTQEMRFETDKEILDVSGVTNTHQSIDYKMEPTDSSLQSHVGVTDEEGNPVHLAMPDGRAVEIVSMDTDSHVVQVKTLEGPRVFIQLPKNQEISEAELVEKIQEAVLEEFPKPKFQKSILLPVSPSHFYPQVLFFLRC